MTQGTYTRPNDLVSCRTDTSSIFSGLQQSPIDFLSKILNKHPYLNLIPNSLLGVAVLAEYNIVKGSTKRLPWPKNICGYLENLNANIELKAQNKAKNNLLVKGVPDTQYNPDFCINQTVLDETTAPSILTGEEVSTGVHLPGSVTYGKCEEEARNPFEDLYKVDWTSYFNNPIFGDISELVPNVTLKTVTGTNPDGTPIAEIDIDIKND